MRFRAGLVGAGYICEYHAAALRRAGVDIVGVSDIDTARARAAGERFGIRHFGSPSDLAAAGANVLHILTPPQTHARLALEALQLGCNVLIEKPLAEDVADCEQIERCAAELGLQVGVNHSLLFDPQIRRALAAVKAGKLGRVVSVDILRSSVYPPYSGGVLPPHYRSAGHPFRDLGVHALYLLEAFLGPITDLQATWKSVGGDSRLAFDEWRAQVSCQDGIGQFQLSWNVRPIQNQLVIQGTRGVMRVDLFLMFCATRKSTALPKPAERLVNAMTDSLRPLIDVPRGVVSFLCKRTLPYHGLQDLVKAFYNALEYGNAVPVSIADGTRVVHWTERVARAAEEEHLRRLQALPLSDRVPVLITGASGALGSEVVKRFRSQGQRVRTFVRRVPDSLPDGVEVAVGDLGDPDAVARAVRGAKVVVHAGAAMKGSWPEHACGTVVGTQNVIDACVKHGVERLVYISSLSVVDWAGGVTDSPIDEQSPFEPQPCKRGNYTRAKLEAERLVQEYARLQKLPTVILRPGQIFGGRIPLLTPAVARRRGRFWIVLGSGDVRLPLVHIDQVVDAIVAACDIRTPTGKIFQVVGEIAPTQNEVLRQTLGPQARVLHVPRAVVFTLGKVSEWLLKPLGRQSPLNLYRLRSGLSRRSFRSLNAQLLARASAASCLNDHHQSVGSRSSREVEGQHCELEAV